MRVDPGSPPPDDDDIVPVLFLQIPKSGSAEQGITRFILEGRFGVVFPQPSAVNVATVLTP